MDIMSLTSQSGSRWEHCAGAHCMSSDSARLQWDLCIALSLLVHWTFLGKTNDISVTLANPKSSLLSPFHTCTVILPLSDFYAEELYSMCQRKCMHFLIWTLSCWLLVIHKFETPEQQDWCIRGEIKIAESEKEEGYYKVNKTSAMHFLPHLLLNSSRLPRTFANTAIVLLCLLACLMQRNSCGVRM